MMSATLSCHHGMVYLVQGNRACEPNNASLGLKVKPSETDRKEKTKKKYNYAVKPQLSSNGWGLQALDLISYGPIAAKAQRVLYQLHSECFIVALLEQPR